MLLMLVPRLILAFFRRVVGWLVLRLRSQSDKPKVKPLVDDPWSSLDGALEALDVVPYSAAVPSRRTAFAQFKRGAKRYIQQHTYASSPPKPLLSNSEPWTPVYDVYTPSCNFTKRAPGRPKLRLLIAHSEEDIDAYRLAQLDKICGQEEVHVAVCQPAGHPSFFCLGSVSHLI
jgi:hypothetical protein